LQHIVLKRTRAADKYTVRLLAMHWSVFLSALTGRTAQGTHFGRTTSVESELTPLKL